MGRNFYGCPYWFGKPDVKESGLVLIAYVALLNTPVLTGICLRSGERDGHSCRACPVVLLGGRQTSSATTLLGLLTVVWERL